MPERTATPGEIPKRIKIVDGRFAPQFPDECEPHTPGAPIGYLGYFEWCQEMSTTHVQRQCRGCGLWSVWEPKPTGDPCDELVPATTEDITKEEQ